ncbi:hypothetical protein J6590_107995, partial [Homalodisca vitripennis]
VKSSWTCHLCGDSRKQQATRKVAAACPPSIGKMDVASLSTDKTIVSVPTDKTDAVIGFSLSNTTIDVNNITLCDIMNETVLFRKEVKETNQQFECVMQKYSEWLEESTKKIEDVENRLISVVNNIEALSQENINLKKTVDDLAVKLNDLEQKGKENEVEIQCIPFQEGENIVALLE